MGTRTLVLSSIILFLTIFNVYGDDFDPVGREVARDGVLTTIAGRLDYRYGEWFVDGEGQDSGISYELHMGPYGHSEDLPFNSGDPAIAKGFAVKGHLAPILVEIDTRQHFFWTAERFPLWAGQGDRRNMVSESGADLNGTAPGLGRRLNIQSQKENDN